MKLEKQAKSRAAESGAELPNSAPITPDLADVLTAWPTLPESVKAGILAMIKATKAGQE